MSGNAFQEYGKSTRFRPRILLELFLSSSAFALKDSSSSGLKNRISGTLAAALPWPHIYDEEPSDGSLAYKITRICLVPFMEDLSLLITCLMLASVVEPNRQIRNTQWCTQSRSDRRSPDSPHRRWHPGSRTSPAKPAQG